MIGCTSLNPRRTNSKCKQCGSPRLLHNIGLPVMMISIGMAILEMGDISFPIATMGGAATLFGIFCFELNVA